MEKERFDKLVQEFFEALRQKRLLIIIDTASKNEKAVFSLVSFGEEIIKYSGMLRVLGFKQYRKESDLFITYCSGRFSLFILDNIGHALRGKDIELPTGFYDWIQYQHAI
ncbi:MAG: hypothetical protein IJ570_01140 [Prevotella sp.]|nr:hypothetical protein [Prevotella sp.]